jgi:hypothetical protein
MSIKELWKDVPNYYGLYQVSNLGRVRRFGESKILAGSRAGKGYSYFIFVKNNRKKGHYLHRLVASLFIGTIPKGYVVNHLDGNKLNNHVGNLEICTYSDNQQHAFDTGLSPKGEHHHNASLSDVQILEIRDLRGKFTGRELALRYGVSPQHISRIHLNQQRKAG